MNDNLKGAMWILVAATCAAGMSLSIRGIGGGIPLMEIVFVRCVIGLGLVIVFSWSRGSINLKTHEWKLVMLRSLLSVGALSLGFYSITILPLTTATVLFFTAPLFVTVLAVPFFGETVGWRRGLATLAGFAGAVIVLRPGIDAFDPNLLFPIASSLTFAAVLLLGKRISRTETIATMMFFAMVVTTLASLPFAVAAWKTPDTWEWTMLVALSLFGTLRGFSDTKGYATGEASVMAPFQYSRIVIVAVAAYFLFAEVPDAFTLTGAAIIVCSSLYIAQREAKLNKGIEGKPKTGVSAP